MKGNPAAGKERLIPAYAGNTFWLAVALVACWAHPRLRGEHC